MIRFATILAALLFYGVAADASTLYVDDDSGVGGDGLTWAAAFSTLQDALEAARVTNSGVTDIHVAGGAYRPDRNMENPEGSGSREATFELPPGVALRGGFGGIGAPDPDLRDTSLFVTILSGDLAGDDVSESNGGLSGAAENSYHILTAIDIDDAAIVDGLVIEGGNGSGSSDDRGGGIRIEGGVDSNLTLLNVMVRRNQAAWGGGIWCSSRALITDSVITDNLAVRGGGAACGVGSTATFQDCRFEENQAEHGGGLWIQSGSATRLAGCTLSLNEASGNGGGISVEEQTFSFCLERSVLAQNLAGSSGGGLSLGYESSAVVISSTFRANSAVFGGGIAADNVLPLQVINTLMTGNTASDSGGGIWWLDSIVQIATCTLHRNMAASGGGVFGASDFYVDTNSISNSILWNNAASLGGDQIALGIGPFGGNEPDTLVVEASDVQGGAEAIDVHDSAAWFLDHRETNIDEDPLFVDADGPDALPQSGDENLSLQQDSPCIAAGIDDLLPFDDNDLDGDGTLLELLPVDRDGAPRVTASSCELNAVPLLDMGALEFQPDCCPGDLDGNGTVGFSDLVKLLSVWGPCLACPADLIPDGVVGFEDLENLIGAWGTCPTGP